MEEKIRNQKYRSTNQVKITRLKKLIKSPKQDITFKINTEPAKYSPETALTYPGKLRMKNKEFPFRFCLVKKANDRFIGFLNETKTK